MSQQTNQYLIEKTTSQNKKPVKINLFCFFFNFKIIKLLEMSK